MATDLKSNSDAFWLTRFAGKKGTSVQITMPREDRTQRSFDFFNYIQLSRDEAKDLALELLLFANEREEESIWDNI